MTKKIVYVLYGCPYSDVIILGLGEVITGQIFRKFAKKCLLLTIANIFAKVSCISSKFF